MTEEIVNKEVLLFIPETDDKYDNAYLTTKDNLGFKMEFAIGYSHEKLQRPLTIYIDRPIHLSELENHKSIGF